MSEPRRWSSSHPGPTREMVDVVDASAYDALKAELEQANKRWYQSNKERAEFEAELVQEKAEYQAVADGFNKLDEKLYRAEAELAILRRQYDDEQDVSELLIEHRNELHGELEKATALLSELADKISYQWGEEHPLIVKARSAAKYWENK